MRKTYGPLFTFMLFGFGSNGFIGNRHNHAQVVVTIDDIVSGVDHSELNLVGPLAVTVCGITALMLYYSSHETT
jgi:hypothetical protein